MNELYMFVTDTDMPILMVIILILHQLSLHIFLEMFHLKINEYTIATQIINAFAQNKHM